MKKKKKEKKKDFAHENLPLTVNQTFLMYTIR